MELEPRGRTLELLATVWGDRLLVALAVAVHVLVFVILYNWGLALYEVGGPGDPWHYFDFASDWLSGQIPYRDFLVEYPVLSLPWFLLPRLFANAPFAYEWPFNLEMLALDLLGLALIADWARRSRSALLMAVGVYTVSVLAIGDIIAKRFDLVPAFLTLAALWVWSRGWRPMAWVLLGVGMMTKLYPALLVPLFALALLRSRRFRELWVGLALFTVTVGLVGGWWATFGIEGMRESLAYQMERGLQVESTYAALSLLVGGLSETPAQIEWTHGAYELVSRQTELLGRASFPIVGILLLMVYLSYWVRSANESNKNHDSLLIWHSVAAVAAFMVAGKVLSPQYFIWLIPLVPLLQGPRSGLIKVLFVGLAALTQWIYPHNYDALLYLEPAAIRLLVFRDLGLFSFVVLLLARSQYPGRILAKRAFTVPKPV
ncbi:MAG: DUF2029 domain-containing protein [Chloroflexi bacterium]|nr:DUF2029 domain-containing protein [Chloroflexota bacterium]